MNRVCFGLAVAVASTFFLVPNAEGFHIQTSSGPTAENQSTVVRRHTHYVHEGVAYLAKCADTEFVCSPQSENLRVRRQMPYVKDYLRLLAKRFDVDARYLENAERGLKSYETAIATLSQILGDASISGEARKNASDKHQELTRTEGTKHRFVQAMAIKTAIESQETVSFAKEQEQFEQAGYPFNFVPDIDATDTTTVFEPSTERVFAIAGPAATRAEAEKLCNAKGKGFHIPRESCDVPAWIYASVLGQAIPHYPAGSSQKAVWLRSAEIVGREGHIEKYPENAFGDVKPYKIRVTYRDARFSIALLNSEVVSTSHTSVNSNNPEEKRSDGEILVAASQSTPKLGVLCVSTSPEDDKY